MLRSCSDFCPAQRHDCTAAAAAAELRKAVAEHNSGNNPLTERFSNFT